MRGLGIAAVIAVLLVGLIVIAMWAVFTLASGEAAPIRVAERPAAVAELAGPWRARPLRLDPVIAADVERVCRSDSEFPDGLHLVLIDARGGGRLPAVFAGEGGMADCAYMEIAGNGRVTGSLSSSGSGLQAQAPPGKVTSHGGGSVDDGGGNEWSYAVGRYGHGVATVVLDVAGIGPITATVQNGWYFAWWPGQAAGGGPPGVLAVSGFDASGGLLHRAIQ